MTTITGRIVLLGATGYTGRLAIPALVRRGARPLLVARDESAVRALAAQCGGLESAAADVMQPASVRRLLSEGDVLVTTVGPFSRLGKVAIEAAIDAGAHYIDSTGEPAWVREVFETHGERAARRGVFLMPAMGYDFVPGNLAGALALERAGSAARRVDIGYFFTGDGRLNRALSGGTLASLGEALLAPAYTRRDGQLVAERGGRRTRRFIIAGRGRSGLSIGASEHFTLSRSYPQVQDVNVYLGWFGALTRLMWLGAAVNMCALRVPAILRAERRLVRKALRGSRGGPSADQRARSRSFIMAKAFDEDGQLISVVDLEGVNGYDFTAEILAWAAVEAASGAVDGCGALGPVDGFGLRPLEQGARQAGLAELHTPRTTPAPVAG